MRCGPGVTLTRSESIVKTALRPEGLSVTMSARLMTGSENGSIPHRFRSLGGGFPSLLFPAAHLYLRILCASILRFWLLEHTTATRSGWLGIATPRLKLPDTSSQKLTEVVGSIPVRKN